MRIRRLEILSEWKNLNGVRVEFDAKRDITVIIGRNGAAKSNLLETIIAIFRDLDLKEESRFAYRLDYQIYGSDVTLQAEVGRHPMGVVDGQPVALQEIRKRWSPTYVVGYYSGVSDRFEELFRKHDLLARNKTLAKGDDAEPTTLELRNFTYARPVHGLFALLAFYFAEDKVATDFLCSMARIEAFDSVLIVIGKPSWAKRNRGPEQFWGARGPVRDLLERIRQHSLAPFTRSVRVDRDFARRSTRELTYLYLPDLTALRSVAQEYGSDPRFLFQALDTMRLSWLIEDFRVRVRVRGSTGGIHTRQLSEGEQQMLTVLGLMRFTQHEESLYILDEPDTHLNPAWGVEYLSNLRDIGGINRHSHTIIATHDPLLVAGLCRDEIRVLRRSDDGRVTAMVPDENPRGQGVASVLTSPLYGLESQLDPFSLRVLKRIYDVTFEPATEKRTRNLRRLRRLVPSLETGESSPDPFRNIARDAYQLAQDIALQGNIPHGRKRAIVERLAGNLFEEATESKNDLYQP
ncbi:MAG: AAA family ATPase [Spirochaeta sp.]|nr:AAA family ATPase [Spirochaeta sp.]